MKIQYDREADALYIQIRQGKAHHAVDVEDARGLTIDVDKDGMPLGIEILKASKLLGPELGRITVEDLLVTLRKRLNEDHPPSRSRGLYLSLAALSSADSDPLT